MYKILLVEDDSALAKEMARVIESYGNTTLAITDFRSVIESFREYMPHLVLLDIMLPFKDGYFWASEIRKISTVPIIFISSASDNMNILMAINMGGDDFIPKPVEPMILNAKIGAVLRRTYEFAESSTIEFHGAVFNLNNSTVSFCGNSTELTKNEFRILQTLLENRNKTVSRETLMIKLWNDDCFVEENTLTVNITRLRKKLEEIGLYGVITTKHGSGYIIQ